MGEKLCGAKMWCSEGLLGLTVCTLTACGEEFTLMKLIYSLTQQRVCTTVITDLW